MIQFVKLFTSTYVNNSRPEEKNSGAWMDTLTTRYKNLTTGEVRLPVGNCS